MRAAQWANSLSDTIRKNPPSDAELPDVIADIQHAERVLRGLRQTLMSEVSGPLVGKEWRLVESRSARRSYNTSGILSTLGGYSVLPDLVSADAVRLQWQWTKLRNYFQREDKPLVITGHEIEDGDDALVGEVWSSSFKPEPL